MKKECKKHFEKLSEYLDGTLQKDLCDEMENHLRRCPECRHCLESMKKTIKLCKEGSNESIPPNLHERLRSRLHECLKNDSSSVS